MKYQSQAHTLKSGRQITVRIPKEKEAQDLINLKLDYIRGTTTLPWTIAEYPADIGAELSAMKEFQNSPNSILLVAEFQGELIGNIDITGNQRSKMFHTGMLGMGIKAAWRNQGLGKILINSALDWARYSSPLEIIWLEVYASNDLGYSLYQNTGFEINGRIKNFFKEETGYIDKVQMYQRIK